MAKLIIIRVDVGDGLESTDFPDPMFCRDDGGPEPKGHSLHPIGHQHARKKIAGSADGLELCAEISFGYGTIERRHRANLPVCEWRNDFAQLLRGNAHLTAAERKYLVLRFPCEP